MNRRVFTAGVAGLMPMTAMAQDATPVPASESISVSLITRYVNDVLNDGKSALLYDLLHPDIDDIEDVYWRYVESHAAEQATMERSSYRLEMVFGDDAQGIGHFIYSEKPKGGELARYGHCIVIRVQDGLISSLQYFSEYKGE